MAVYPSFRSYLPQRISYRIIINERNLAYEDGPLQRSDRLKTGG